MLKDLKIRKRLVEKVVKLVDVGAPDLCGYFKDGILKACVKKRWKRSKGDTWWWNKEVKEEVSRKKDAQRVMCRNSTEENFFFFLGPSITDDDVFLFNVECGSCCG